MPAGVADQGQHDDEAQEQGGDTGRSEDHDEAGPEQHGALVIGDGAPAGGDGFDDVGFGAVQEQRDRDDADHVGEEGQDGAGKRAEDQEGQVFGDQEGFNDQVFE